MMTQTAGDHPGMCDPLEYMDSWLTISVEYEIKPHSVNRLLPETQSKKGQEYLSNPQLAFAMKEGTKVVHSAAENSVFTK